MIDLDFEGGLENSTIESDEISIMRYGRGMAESGRGKNLFHEKATF